MFSQQFEDDENLLSLSAGAVADLALSIPVSRSFSVFALVENLGDVEIETGRTAAGVTSIGTPRTIVAGFRTGF